jgi:hypothetical protein
VPSRSIERITLETIAGGERLVGHRLEHLLHRQDAGGVARLLLRCSKFGDPVSDRTFFLFMRRDLCRSLTLLRLASGTKVGAKPLVRFGRNQASVALIAPDIEHQPAVLCVQVTALGVGRWPAERTLLRLLQKRLRDLAATLAIRFAFYMACRAVLRVKGVLELMIPTRLAKQILN